MNNKRDYTLIELFIRCHMTIENPKTYKKLVQLSKLTLSRCFHFNSILGLPFSCSHKKKWNPFDPSDILEFRENLSSDCFDYVMKTSRRVKL